MATGCRRPTPTDRSRRAVASEELGHRHEMRQLVRSAHAASAAACGRTLGCAMIPASVMTSPTSLPCTITATPSGPVLGDRGDGPADGLRVEVDAHPSVGRAGWPLRRAAGRRVQRAAPTSAGSSTTVHLSVRALALASNSPDPGVLVHRRPGGRLARSCRRRSAIPCSPCRRAGAALRSQPPPSRARGSASRAAWASCRAVSPASWHRHQPRGEHQPVAGDGHRLRVPRLRLARQPPFTAYPIRDLRRALPEDHPVEALQPRLCCAVCSLMPVAPRLARACRTRPG